MNPGEALNFAYRSGGPMAVIRNGEGPSILLMAGNHGDEYEGQDTLARLIHDLEGSDIRGRVIVMPAATSAYMDPVMMPLRICSKMNEVTLGSWAVLEACYLAE